MRRFKRPKNLGARLNAVIESLSKVPVLERKKIADIGSDHGYVPIFAYFYGIIESAIAVDIASGPLAITIKHVKKYGLESKIEARLGDGLAPLLPNEAGTAIISGMGGIEICRIIADAKTNYLILQPQRDFEKTINALENLNYCIEEISETREKEKVYKIIRARILENNLI